MTRAALVPLVLALAGCGERPLPAGVQGNPERGRVALNQYACRACHMIPGVTGSEVYVGRPLDKLAERRFIAGALPNNQENLIKWIRNPKQIDPLTAMPVLDVSEADARDMAAYLLTLR
ncbi:c-type cytochrome [Massilia sp. TWR1-2-2]|uniref:c-type cytochrome n=1 Tax=Massilia sp. TWR1-2-2 TaxID=2804584 RepID=UPI003CFA77BC